jgi:hypothetical protein
MDIMKAARTVVAGLSAAACMFAWGGTALAQPTPPLSPTQLDQISWQSFVMAVRPSSVAGKVVYETWASDQDIYVANPCPITGKKTPGCNVPTWPSPSANGAIKPFQTSVLGRSHLGLTRMGGGVEVIGPAQGCTAPVGITTAPKAAANSGFPSGGCVGEEVRRDRMSFAYLVQAGLWSKAGLKAFYNTGRPVGLPWNALDVKADWIPVATLAQWLGKTPAFVTANFYTATAQASKNGPKTAYAMTSIHISIKAAGFPDWVWADFENAYTPGRCDQTGCIDNFGAKVAKVAANTTPWGQYSPCTPTTAATKLMAGAKVAAIFGNYCLTGTQVKFGTATKPTLLGSPIIEPLNANVPLAASSCISCHAGASFNAAGPNFNVGQPVGPHAAPAGYRTYDFMWGVLNAK